MFTRMIYEKTEGGIFDDRQAYIGRYIPFINFHSLQGVNFNKWMSVKTVNRNKAKVKKKYIGLEEAVVDGGNLKSERIKAKLLLMLCVQRKGRTWCVCVIISVCLISVAVWPDLGLFAVSSCSSVPASCKIKWRTAHAHSKSEIAGPLCTVCV